MSSPLFSLADLAERRSRRVERLLTGRNSKVQTPSGEAIWSSLIFQNFVSVIADRKPKDRPDPWMWEGMAPDSEGKESRDHPCVRNGAVAEETLRYRFPRCIRSAGRIFEAHELTYACTFNALAAHIPHPSGSRGWTYERSEPAVQFLLKSINGRRRAADVQLANSIYLD
jgi:hypothetical protein